MTDNSPDYIRGFNEGIDKVMQILHERCVTTFDPTIKLQKLREPRKVEQSTVVVSRPQIYDKASDSFRDADYELWMA